MKEYELFFGKVLVHSAHLAEVFINQGVVMDLPIVDEYHSFLRKHLTAPFNLLINKINSYSYTDEAQRELATIREINAMAVVTHNRISALAQKTLEQTPKSRKWHICHFQSRDEALEWLQNQV